ncbi:MAG: ATP-binding cassette domain-containing protein [Anaerolineae bacterium]|nr:ATP-binding cassette domain-containing protein [Anaerolineae bacterium]NIN99872.1 ATP-binding cassette domain-containing protein [Anaerolineae bacterium]NIQ82649.1 ATP-binding cassette domain-containing protein [Anaerolineae bacterium]
MERSTLVSSTSLLHAEAIDKSFPGVHALDHVDFDLHEGEVHVVLGENGAGKSTLMKIFSGSLPRDSGRILIRGEEVEIRNPQHARDLGIGMVYQELSLIPTLSTAENILLGRLPRRRPLNTVDWPEVHSRAADILSDLGADIDPSKPVRGLSMAERQLTEIAKALSMKVQILLLDEPTSALSDEERDHLFDTIRRLQERGVAVIYVSHRLPEVPQIGQRVTVLRDGKGVGTLSVSEGDEATLIRMMVGRELVEQFPKEEVELGKEILRIDGLTVKGKLRDISLSLHEGEIVGIFGVMGAGRTDLARTLFGFERPESGDIVLNGNKVRISSPWDAIDLGLGYMTEDRRDGLVPRLPIPPNITLASLDRMTRLGFLRREEERRAAEHYVQELDIATPSLSQKVELLSGGNQQKVALAKWLCSESKILILDEPTRGIDVGAKVEVFRLMNNLAGEGVGVIMISSELPEVLAMADRIFVMARGRIMGEFAGGECTQEDILRCAVE